MGFWGKQKVLPRNFHSLRVRDEWRCFLRFCHSVPRFLCHDSWARCRAAGYLYPGDKGWDLHADPSGLGKHARHQWYTKEVTTAMLISHFFWRRLEYSRVGRHFQSHLWWKDIMEIMGNANHKAVHDLSPLWRDHLLRHSAVLYCSWREWPWKCKRFNCVL